MTDLNYALKDTLSSFKENVTLYDSSLTQKTHGTMINLLTEDVFSLKTAYNILDVKEKMSLANMADLLKKIATIKIIYPTSFDAFDEVTMTIKPEIVIFTARYLIKTRATYFFLFILFLQKHAQFVDLYNQLREKYNILVQYPSKNVNAVDASLFLTQLKTTILSQIDNIPENKELITKINQVFMDQSKEYLTTFQQLGKLIEDINGVSNGFRSLVMDVIPKITTWKVSGPTF